MHKEREPHCSQVSQKPRSPKQGLLPITDTEERSTSALLTTQVMNCRNQLQISYSIVGEQHFYQLLRNYISSILAKPRSHRYVHSAHKPAPPGGKPCFWVHGGATHVESDVANQCQIKDSACCHKLSFRFIKGKAGYKILNKSDLTKAQVPFAKNHLFNKLYFTSSWTDYLKHPCNKGLQYNKKQVDWSLLQFLCYI